ncbi:MAG: zinc-ribbon domain-containing protein [bacterium]|nr:zinc-ribbon domain-containing protein [bacterium]
MQKNSPFKYVFFALLAVIVLSISALFRFTSIQVGNGVDSPWVVLIPAFLILVLFISIIGPLVFKDARKRGMDPWLWATVAVFIPNLLGVIIYLVVRHSHSGNILCTKCSKKVQTDFKLCPYCGHNQENKCPQCNKQVSTDWKLCPHCGHNL